MTRRTISPEVVMAMAELGGTMPKAQIARTLGVGKHNVQQHLGSTVDSAEWEEERQRHAGFFGGLTPAQEYKRHAQERKAINDKLDEEAV